MPEVGKVAPEWRCRGGALPRMPKSRRPGRRARRCRRWPGADADEGAELRPGMQRRSGPGLRPWPGRAGVMAAEAVPGWCAAELGVVGEGGGAAGAAISSGAGARATEALPRRRCAGEDARRGASAVGGDAGGGGVGEVLGRRCRSCLMRARPSTRRRRPRAWKTPESGLHREGIWSEARKGTPLRGRGVGTTGVPDLV